MPNYCQNRLLVEGPAESLDKFSKDIKGEKSDLSIERIIPEPPEGDPRRIPSSTHEGGWDWYSWRVENWGTKWDIHEAVMTKTDQGLVYAFDSAWAPPLEAIKRISIAYPELKFSFNYLEAGMAFYGTAIYQDEGVLEEREAEFNYEDCELDEDTGEVISIADPILKAHVEEHDFAFYS